MVVVIGIWLALAVFVAVLAWWERDFPFSKRRQRRTATRERLDRIRTRRTKW